MALTVRRQGGKRKRTAARQELLGVVSSSAPRLCNAPRETTSDRPAERR
jgi:hypothetical protein